MPKKLQNTVSEYYIAKRDLIGHVEEPKEDYDLIDICLLYTSFFVSATRARDELYIVSQRYAYGSKGNGKNILDTRVQNRFLEEAVKAVIQK